MGITYTILSNFEGRAGASSILGELEGNQAGAVAVQASAYTDKIRRDDDEVEGPFEHCLQQPSGFNKQTYQATNRNQSKEQLTERATDQLMRPPNVKVLVYFVSISRGDGID
jgi:hypothetical protein